MTDVNDLIDDARVEAARAKHQAAIEAEAQAGADADQKHQAAVSAGRAADAALLSGPDVIATAEAKAEAAQKAAELASRIAAARTTALRESATERAESVKQAYAAAVRSAVLARVAAVRRAGELLAKMKETEAAYREADRDLQRCQAEGGVSYPLELKIGDGLMRADGKPISVGEHENRLRGCGYSPETGTGHWMENANV